ncbi:MULTISPECIES: ABC transporter ATP-binding protein [Actinosynnema]|uniref:energy-coupling factor ABC transporter ATP-binding protein n=1 Tax=Actinosynnema TaxID=40566 RepID=UPI0020A3F835|nr:ABC transporter ATP-binding protein [Actinosynnema pretiosum]MCP2097737.1 energy-coupling factor transport system ATP-binding protein [Actinosynnema pretiosum]
MTILIEDVVFRYGAGTTALDRVSLSIAPGEKVALVGPNGAGKSTLARHLNGMLRPTSGRVLVNGLDTSEHPISRMAAEVGFVFQNPDDQLHARTIGVEVHFGPKNLGFPPERAQVLVERALAATGLEGQADVHPHHLSPARRKLVAIASVLAMDTPVVVLDEPTAGQDRTALDALGDLVDALAAGGRTVLAITHDLDFCVERFDRVLLLESGRITMDGPPLMVFARQGGRAPQLLRLSRELGWSTGAATAAEFVDLLGERAGS